MEIARMSTYNDIEEYFLDLLDGECEEVKNIVNDWRKGVWVFAEKYKFAVRFEPYIRARDIIMQAISDGLG